MKRLGVVVMLVLAGWSGAAAAPFDPQCPRSIQTRQALVSDVKGWIAHVDDPFSSGRPAGNDRAPIRSDLRHVTLYDGHPAEKASLAPDRTDRNRNTWNLASDNRPRSYWIGCHYGGTNVTLIAEVPREITSCEVAYRDNFTIVERVACK